MSWLLLKARRSEKGTQRRDLLDGCDQTKFEEQVTLDVETEDKVSMGCRGRAVGSVDVGKRNHLWQEATRGSVTSYRREWT